MRRCGGSQANQGEVLNNCCYITSALETLCSKSHVITFDYKIFCYNINIYNTKN